MPATKEIRNRIRSVKNIAKSTKAMELVSAAKMRRSQEAATKGRPYSILINEVLRDIAGQIDTSVHPLLVGKGDGKEAAVLVSTNRGLCGALNSNLFRKTFDLPTDCSFITIGRKGELFISKTAHPLVADFELVDKPNLETAHTLAKFLTDNFLAGEFSKIHIIYSNFESTLKQTPTVKTLLPIINETILEQIKNQAESKNYSEYKFEPSADQVLESMLPHYIEMELYQVLVEASASEHSARMVAMKNASDNAGDLVDELTLDYNQLRQAAITNELLDITTASITLE